MPNTETRIIIGGGAAGFFGAVTCARANPEAKIILLEKHKQLLAKVRISGGGRCNVTHSCFDPEVLVQNYPRGGKALRGPFNQFQPKDIIQWFADRGVLLKTEEDGRMFPSTDSSQTIIHCLLEEAQNCGVDIRVETGVEQIEKTASGFALHTTQGDVLECAKLLIATGGSSRQSYAWAESLGHTIIPAVPSLFTFNVPSSPLLHLAGISVEHVRLKIAQTQLEQTGPLLITHWGFSGPAVLKLSAWGARILHDREYHAELIVNWLPSYKKDQLLQHLMKARKESPGRFICSETLFPLPRNLWKSLLLQAGIDEQMRWSHASNKHLSNLTDVFTANLYRIEGKTTFKQEFVTCGGINLSEVNFKTMESRLCPGLYFAGEVLDIDGITGGFNFQSAWTTSWIAGHAMASSRK